MKNKVSPWSTWDIKSINAVMNINNMSEIKIGIYNDFEKAYLDNAHPSKNVSRYGIHSVSGDYFEIEYKIGDFVFNMEFAGNEDEFTIKLTPKSDCKDIYYYVSAHIMWNTCGSIRKEKDCLNISSKGENFKITCSGDIDGDCKYYFNAPGLLIDSKKTVYIFCNMENDIESADKMIREKRTTALLDKNDKDISGKARDAIHKAIMWNTVYDAVNDRIITPVTRSWCLCDDATFSVFGTYVLFCWDTFFNGLLSSVFDKDLAYNQIYTILSEATERGMIPNTNSHRKKSLDRSQPPVGSYCVWKLYEKYKDTEFLEKTFDKLYSWNRFWMEYRDGNGDGLIEFGSDIYSGKYRTEEYAKITYSHTPMASKLESGLDNSPMYDNIKFNEKTNTMEFTDIGLNSLYALDLLSLSKIAKKIGKDGISVQLEKEYQDMKQKINTELWNEEMGIYCNKYWDGKFSLELSPTCFYPLISNIADREKAKTMIEKYLLNEDEFWGEFVIPSTPKSSPHFKDDEYWRGRIWAPMNFLVYEGLKNSGFDDVAKSLAQKGFEMFISQWENENKISENYRVEKGDGGGDSFYTWGSLLAYMAIDSEL